MPKGGPNNIRRYSLPDDEDRAMKLINASGIDVVDDPESGGCIISITSSISESLHYVCSFFGKSPENTTTDTIGREHVAFDIPKIEAKRMRSLIEVLLVNPDAYSEHRRNILGLTEKDIDLVCDKHTRRQMMMFIARNTQEQITFLPNIIGQDNGLKPYLTNSKFDELPSEMKSELICCWYRMNEEDKKMFASIEEAHKSRIKAKADFINPLSEWDVKQENTNGEIIVQGNIYPIENNFLVDLQGSSYSETLRICQKLDTYDKEVSYYLGEDGLYHIEAILSEENVEEFGEFIGLF